MFRTSEINQKITQNYMTTVKIYLYMFLLVIIESDLDSLHRYHEIIWR